MLNRRILRIKAFKVLYSSALSDDLSLARALEHLDASCEATRDLYLYMLSIVSPLTAVARERMEAAMTKFNPTEEEKCPNTKFVENGLAVLLDEDPDFRKHLSKRRLSWQQYDLFLKKVMSSVVQKKYYQDYMSSDSRGLAEDCRLFISIFEEEFVDSPELEKILEDMSIYWNDDLAYSLTWCCKTLKSLAKGERWSLPLLYQSDMMTGEDVESDRDFVRRLLQASFTGFDRYSSMVAESVHGWEKERLFSTDMALIVMGIAEAVTFPTIPVKVTLNEYVEISKFYGTPKSRSFVNGLLDRHIQALVNDGQILKEGKGLL